MSADVTSVYVARERRHSVNVTDVNVGRFYDNYETKDMIGE